MGIVIDVFSSDEPEHRFTAMGLTRGLQACGHDALILPHPHHKREGCELMIEVGAKLVDNFPGVPFVHWVIEPQGDAAINPKWINAMLKGHIFTFADYDSSIRAHQQGIRTAEYLPLGWDSLLPYTPTPKKEDIQVGYFGNPYPEIVKVLEEVRAEYPNWKIGVWGNSEMWAKTPFGSCVVEDLPFEAGDVIPKMDRCRYVIDDVRSKRPGFWFFQACASQAIALTPFSGDKFDLFDQSPFMFAHGGIVACIKSINHAGLYRETKKDQISAVGTKDVPTWAKLTEMVYGEHRHNRLMDRAMYLLSILESKSLYEVAKTVCKEHRAVKYEIDDPWGFIKLTFPYKNDRRQFDFVWEDKAFNVEELPTMLRIAAKRIEMSIVNNAYRNNLVMDTGKPSKVPEREQVNKAG